MSHLLLPPHVFSSTKQYPERVLFIIREPERQAAMYCRNAIFSYDLVFTSVYDVKDFLEVVKIEWRAISDATLDL